MSILRSLQRMLVGDPGEPLMLDHVPVIDCPDWRTEKLKAASEKLGHPFKCGPDGLPRETMKDKAFVTVGSETRASVTRIEGRKRK